MKKKHYILGAINFEVYLQFFPKYQQGQDMVLQYNWGWQGKYLTYLKLCTVTTESFLLTANLLAIKR